jgi:hypothetical protein
VLDAYHLPALDHLATTVWPYGRGPGAVELRIPQLTPALLAEQIDALLEARERHLAERPVAEIVEAVDAVAGRLMDPADELRRAAEAGLPAVTGASPAMVRRVLDGLAADWRRPRLRELLRAEFGDPSVLDDFRPRGHTETLTRAFGPRLAAHVFSGHVPGPEVTSLIRSLLVKAATLGRTAAGEPLLAPLFARGLAEVDPGLGACMAVTYWPAGDTTLERLALDCADAVVAHGPQEAVDAVRERAPRTARFVGYPQRVSLGIAAREALTAAGAGELARRAALDVGLFDQQRFLSPHLFYAEEGGEVSPEEWAARLAEELRRLEGELPRGAVAPGEAAEIRHLRAEAESAQLAGQGVRLHASGDGTAWTVIFDPDPAFERSCRNRVVRVKPLPELHDAIPRLRSLADGLQAVGLAGPPDRLLPLARELGRLGASRVTPIGRMPFAPAAWHHDGQPPLRALVRWTDLEEITSYEL